MYGPILGVYGFNPLLENIFRTVKNMQCDTRALTSSATLLTHFVIVGLAAGA